MQRLLLILVGLAAGCSLIVGNKLDEKSSADGSLRKDGVGPDSAPPTVITGETTTGEGPYLIGERVIFPTTGNLAGATRIYIGYVPCVGGPAWGGAAFVCTVSPNTPDGVTAYWARNAAGKTLNANPLGDRISIRRLIVGSKVNNRVLQTRDQATLVDMGSIDLGAPLVAPPKLSPSGRYLLAPIKGGGAVVQDLVNRSRAQLPAACSNVTGSSFEPSFEMLLTSATEKFMYYRPETRLWCAGAEAMVTVELPPPPLKLAGTLTEVKAPIPILNVKQSTALVDLSGQAWMVGISGNEVFAANLTARTKATLVLPPPFVPEQALLTVLETSQKQLKYSTESYVVALAKDPTKAQPPKLLLLRAEGNHLAPRAERELVGAGNANLNVRSLFWYPYTNLIGFDRDPAQAQTLSYARAATVNGSPVLQLIEGEALTSNKEIRAFGYSSLSWVLFIPQYVRRPAVVAGNQIVVVEEADAGLKVIVKNEPVGFAGGPVVGHPLFQRVFGITGSVVVPYEPNNSQELVKKGSAVSFEADGILIQP